MSEIKLKENEKRAIFRLKEALKERYALLDFRLFGSKARGEDTTDSDIDIMIELEEYTPQIESEIDDLVFEINLSLDCFISTVIFGKKELEEGPLGESPIYRVIAREGIKV